MVPRNSAYTLGCTCFCMGLLPGVSSIGLHPETEAEKARKFKPRGYRYTTDNRYKLAPRDSQAAGGRNEQAGALLPMTWGWNVDEEYIQGKRGFARGGRCQEGPSRKGKRDLCWFQGDRRGTGTAVE